DLHRPERYGRALRGVLFMSALSSVRAEGPDRRFHRRKRAEGLKRVQAVIAPARRRASVPWAPLRGGRAFTPAPPVPQTARRLHRDSPERPTVAQAGARGSSQAVGLRRSPRGPAARGPPRAALGRRARRDPMIPRLWGRRRPGQLAAPSVRPRRI